ncbi:peptidoglycan DD-metalloendopeptidase family protein [Thiohalophilus sp.]|uniref:peptidoglycan DD-metalloendopeptidase family protein n=1 Tax=Thiohalophilus sp. TaxID=3028392 RepID=UPI002ACD3143|nr:peptidoglycan DD-metalloendopeptidase family protein [Thiohalophilus sp.]MDZ7662493.1 peptidoglycan DD-metalloendopeptidase family protein [Thiohalophilus sp.]
MRITGLKRDASSTRKHPALAVFLLLLSTTVHGQVYKYQDEDGVWHFSDSPPGQNATDATIAADDSPAMQQQVIIHRLGSDEAPVFEVTNTLPAPIELAFSAREMQNMRADPPLPLRKVIASGTREPLTRFEKIDPARPWGYAYASRYVLGDPQAQHRSGKPYLPPYPRQKDFAIGQAFDGERSHRQHPLTRYAVDIPMPAQSDIAAARSGHIVEINTGKLAPVRRQQTHYVRVLHQDGTFGLYAHLDPASIRMLPGTPVDRGQVIGQLAASADGEIPHLHFAVQKNTGMKLESIPFDFTSLEGTPVEPKTDLPLHHPL